MKAIVCKELGPPEKLVWEDVESRPVGPNEVRIAVHAAGVNFPDTLIIQGRYQFKAEPPFTPGGEVAGIVREVGDKVQHVRPGDHAVSVSAWGGYAEETVVPADTVVPISGDLDLTLAAALPMTYGTSIYALRQRAGLKPGETLLVLGAAGGVGLSAVQLGKAMGARVIAAASTDEKLALCRANGADETVNYSDGDLKSKVMALTGGKGADVIYDPVGGELFQQSLSCVNWNGRVLVIGFASGEIPQLSVNRVLLKGCAVVGVFWGAFVAREPRVNAENFEQLMAWLGEGRIRPHVGKTYPMSRAADALNDMMARRVQGKAVLLPDRLMEPRA